MPAISMSTFESHDIDVSTPSLSSNLSLSYLLFSNTVFDPNAAKSYIKGIRASQASCSYSWTMNCNAQNCYGKILSFKGEAKEVHATFYIYSVEIHISSSHLTLTQTSLQIVTSQRVRPSKSIAELLMRYDQLQIRSRNQSKKKHS